MCRRTTKQKRKSRVGTPHMLLAGIRRFHSSVTGRINAFGLDHADHGQVDYIHILRHDPGLQNDKDRIPTKLLSTAGLSRNQLGVPRY
jgi:hypothetical protein